MVNVLAPLLVLVVGVLVYSVPSPGRLTTLGLWAYVVGLFWLLANFARTTIHF